MLAECSVKILGQRATPRRFVLLFCFLKLGLLVVAGVLQLHSVGGLRFSACRLHFVDGFFSTFELIIDVDLFGCCDIN